MRTGVVLGPEATARVTGGAAAAGVSLRAWALAALADVLPPDRVAVVGVMSDGRRGRTGVTGAGTAVLPVPAAGSPGSEVTLSDPRAAQAALDRLERHVPYPLATRLANRVPALASFELVHDTPVRAGSGPGHLELVDEPVTLDADPHGLALVVSVRPGGPGDAARLAVRLDHGADVLDADGSVRLLERWRDRVGAPAD